VNGGFTYLSNESLRILTWRWSRDAVRSQPFGILIPAALNESDLVNDLLCECQRSRVVRQPVEHRHRPARSPVAFHLNLTRRLPARRALLAAGHADLAACGA
jgi:hypothetical protein